MDDQKTNNAEKGFVELIQGDCLEVMDKLIEQGVKVDLIVTDPPYKVITGGKNGEVGKPSGILTKNKQLMCNIPSFESWLKKSYDILNADSHAYFMTNLLNLNYMLTEITKAGFYIHNLLIWKKNNATPNKWYMKNCEYIIFCKKGKSKFINNCGSKTVHEFNNPRKKIHPTQKPVELMEMYIENSTSKNQIVLDPFMGSGTTGVACLNLNRNFIGIELDEKYFNIAKDRINDTICQK